MRRTGWIASQSHIVGTLDDYDFCYDWSGELHDSRERAISAGLREFGSDDFNVVKVENDVVVWVGWMDEEHPEYEDRDAAARGLGLAGARP